MPTLKTATSVAKLRVEIGEPYREALGPRRVTRDPIDKYLEGLAEAFHEGLEKDLLRKQQRLKDVLKTG